LKSEELETKVKTLAETVKKLEARLQAQEDIEAIKKIAKGVWLLPRTLAGRGNSGAVFPQPRCLSRDK